MRVPWRRKATMDRGIPEPTDLVAERQRDVEFRDRLISHAPALVGVAIFAFVTLKITIIARNNTSTALALVGRAGPLSALTGILIEHLPALATGLSLAGIA
jgi:hypothetical protein